MLKICVAEKIKILIPGFDTELEVLKNNENKFKKIGTLIIVGSKRLIEIANNKFELSNWLKENKFNYLKTYRLEDRKKIKSHLKFPFIVFLSFILHLTLRLNSVSSQRLFCIYFTTIML